MEAEDKGDIENNPQLSGLLSWVGGRAICTGRTFWEFQVLLVPDGSVSTLCVL